MAGAVTVTPFGTPAMVRATTGSITASWGTGQNRAAGNILVAVVTAGCSTAAAIAPSTPAGWTQEAISPNTATTYNAVAAVYTKIAAGADAAPAFTATLTGTGAMTVTLLELGGAGKPADTTGKYASGASAGTLTAMTVTSAAAPLNTGEYAITGFAMERAASTNTWNPGTTGWANATTDGATSSVLHSAVDVLANPATSAALAETGGHWTTNTTAFGAAVMFVAVPLTGATEVYANNPSTTISSGGTAAPASGTTELWTAASSAAFPAVTAAGAAQFHITDPALPAELMTVLNVAGTTWTVVRGAENTTPAAHTAGFTVQQVATAGSLAQTQQVFSVRAFGAKGDGVTDDTAAIQAAINTAQSSINNINGGFVYIPPGAYIISSPLTVTGLVSLVGAGGGPYAGNISPVTIYQSSTTANGINLVTGPLGQSDVRLEGFLLAGPLSGTGKGIYANPSGAPENIRITDVTVDSFGGNGVEITQPIVSRLEGVVSQNNGGEGFYINGGGGGTSVTFINCWANANALTGWHVFNMAYCSLVSCAADANGRGYYLDSCIGVGLHGCGAEANVAKNTLDGSSLVMTNCRGITAASFATFTATGTCIYVTGSSNGITIIGFQETSPAAGMVNSVKVDAGCRATVINPNLVTAQSLAVGTTDGISYDGAGSWQVTGTFTSGNVFSYGDVSLQNTVLQLLNATTPPTGAVSGGGKLFTASGLLKYLNTAGLSSLVQQSQAGATSAVTVVSSAAIASLGSLTVPANDAVAGAVYRFCAYGTFGTAASVPTATVDIRWGGTAGTLITSILTATDTVALTASLSATPVTIEGEVEFRTSTTCVARLRMTWKNSATAATAMTVAEKAITAPVTVTTSSQQSLSLNWTWSASNASDTITIASSSFERVS